MWIYVVYRRYEGFALVSAEEKLNDCVFAIAFVSRNKTFVHPPTERKRFHAICSLRGECTNVHDFVIFLNLNWKL